MTPSTTGQGTSRRRSGARVPPALRVIASDTAKIQRIDHLFVTQPDISNDWRTHIRVERYIKKESGEAVSYEWYVEQAESFLRRRAAQDALRDGLANKVALAAEASNKDLSNQIAAIVDAKLATDPKQGRDVGAGQEEG